MNSPISQTCQHHHTETDTNAEFDPNHPDNQSHLLQCVGCDTYEDVQDQLVSVMYRPRQKDYDRGERSSIQQEFFPFCNTCFEKFERVENELAIKYNIPDDYPVVCGWDWWDYADAIHEMLKANN